MRTFDDARRAGVRAPEPGQGRSPGYDNGDALQAFRVAMMAALGYAPERIEPGRLHRFSTSDRPNDDAGWCMLFADLRGGVFGCHRHGVSQTWRAADRKPLTRGQLVEFKRHARAARSEREAQQRQGWGRNAQQIAEVWGQAVPLTPDDPCALYLKRRGIRNVWPLPQRLRLHHALPHWHAGKKLGSFPTMLAPVVAPDGRLVALHRTFLTADGHKAQVPSPKKLTGVAGPLAGACIPLHEPEAGRIGIAEGIETALAAWCAFGVPTVAAYCAGNLAAWRWPGGVHSLVIFADNDKAGREAADTLRVRALGAGLRCKVLAPTEPGADWCDVWAARDAALPDFGGSV